MLRGEVIKRLRKESEMTQEKLAEKLNISTEAVSKWERGDSSPDIDNLTMLADIFGTSTDYLLGRSVERYADTVADYHRLAKEYEKKEDYKKALEIYKEGIKRFPDSYTLKINAAIEASNIVNENYKKWSEYDYEQEILLEKLSPDFEEVVEILASALESAEDSETVYNLLHFIGQYAPLNKSAEKTFNKYLKKLSSFSFSRENLLANVNKSKAKQHQLISLIYDEFIEQLCVLLDFKIFNGKYNDDFLYDPQEREALIVLSKLLFLIQDDQFMGKEEEVLQIWCAVLHFALKDYSQRDEVLQVMKGALSLFEYKKFCNDNYIPTEKKSILIGKDKYSMDDYEEDSGYIPAIFDAVATDEYKQDKEIVDICNKIRTIKDQ